VEVSALRAPSGLIGGRTSVGGPLLRLRSDEQLVALFRAGNDEAFRVIHDRYRQRLFAYTRQMLPGSRHDAEDALQDVFVRAYGGLRANDRSLALRAWLYRVAHNRCIDELRRPVPPAPEVLELVRPPVIDPIAEAEKRESLRRLVADVRRLPDQQRSALLMRELGGMSYNDIAPALGVSVPAIKSLLVRARVSLAQAAEARDTSCAAIREDLVLAHDRGVRPGGVARRHLHDCHACREFRGQLRHTSRQFAALIPGFAPAAVAAKLLGGGFGFGGGGGAAGAGGAAAVGTGSGIASVGVLATGAGHVATLLAAAVVTAGGAVEIQQTIVQHSQHHSAGTQSSGAPAGASATAIAGPKSVAVAAISVQAAILAPFQPAPNASPLTHKLAAVLSSHSIATPSPPPAPASPASAPASPPTVTSSTPAATTPPSDPGSGTLPGTDTTGAVTPPPGDGSTSTSPTSSTPPDSSTPADSATPADTTTPADTSTTPADPSTATPSGPDGSDSSTAGATPAITTAPGPDGSTGSGGTPGTN
jgi:RNA polymerase sigma factor (sigma-70 family)